MTTCSTAVAGDDVIAGGAGHDTLLGGAGDDQLYDDAGEDNLAGGSGDDVIAAGHSAGETVVMFGRLGRRRLRLHHG